MRFLESLLERTILWLHFFFMQIEVEAHAVRCELSDWHKPKLLSKHIITAILMIHAVSE